MSAEEFRRQKTAAGEPVPPEVQEATTTVRGREDLLGYDMSDYGAAVDRMVAMRGLAAPKQQSKWSLRAFDVCVYWRSTVTH